MCRCRCRAGPTVTADPVRSDEVRLAVAVDIRGGHRLWNAADRERALRLEKWGIEIPSAQQHRHRVVEAVDRDDIDVAVTVRVSRRNRNRGCADRVTAPSQE